MGPELTATGFSVGGMRPTVIIQHTVSVDGRLTGFPIDVGLYYELAAGIPHDAVLSGSGTLLAAAREHGVDLSGEDDPPAAGPGTDGPLLVVVDSRARLTRLGWLRAQPFWRDVVVLCSRATPAAHLRRLDRLRAGHIVTGDDHVDLAAALQELHSRYAVTGVRVDAGPTLAARLLEAGLVDELNLVIAPHLADPPTSLALLGSARQRAGQLHVRYAVSGPTGADPAG
jgi:2,5-diamino-6-(ribosylamino)-4(3H)-pyrimidinone 5'-phosphate reductase